MFELVIMVQQCNLPDCIHALGEAKKEHIMVTRVCTSKVCGQEYTAYKVAIF